MAGFVDVTGSDEVPEGETKGFAVDGTEIALARVDGTVYAFSDICTHRQCNLASGGEIDGTTIVCECHGSVFSLPTGEAVGPPATEPIPVYGVREDGGRIQVEL